MFEFETDPFGYGYLPSFHAPNVQRFARVLLTGFLWDRRTPEDHDFQVFSQEKIDEMLSNPRISDRQALKELCIGPAISFCQIGSQPYYVEKSFAYRAITGLTVFDTCLMWNADFLFLENKEPNVGRIVYFNNEYTPELVATKVLTHMLNGEVYFPACVDFKQTDEGFEFSKHAVLEDEY